MHLLQKFPPTLFIILFSVYDNIRSAFNVNDRLYALQ